MIAVATWRAFGFDLASNGAHRRIPRSTFFIGIGTPIRPVEHTRTWFGFNESAFAVIRAIVSASRIPCAPVAAFAFPEFTTIARAKSLAATFRLTLTGAAQT